MKQFNLEEYLANPSRKVVTRDGRKVRIVCTDVKSINPILALVSYGKEEVPFLYDRNGKYNSSLCLAPDLFFAPEKKEGWVNLYKDLNDNSVYCENVYKSEEEAKKEKHINYITTIKIEWEE